MNLYALLFLVAGFGAIAWLTGRARAAKFGAASTRRLHSLPGQHGLYVAMWTVIPTLIFVIAWWIVTPSLATEAVLKSPLAAIDLTLQNLARLDGVPPEIHTRHQRLHRASRRLQGLINEYLNADRMAGSDPVAVGERFDLRAVVEEAVRLSAEMAGHPNITTVLPSVP